MDRALVCCILVIVIQQIMRVTRQIVLPLLIKALYEFGFFEGISQNFVAFSEYMNFIQQILRVTRRIVLPLLIKALYEFGCFKGILQRAKFALLLIY